MRTSTFQSKHLSSAVHVHTLGLGNLNKINRPPHVCGNRFPTAKGTPQKKDRTEPEKKRQTGRQEVNSGKAVVIVGNRIGSVRGIPQNRGLSLRLRKQRNCPNGHLNGRPHGPKAPPIMEFNARDIGAIKDGAPFYGKGCVCLTSGVLVKSFI